MKKEKIPIWISLAVMGVLSFMAGMEQTVLSGFWDGGA